MPRDNNPEYDYNAPSAVCPECRYGDHARCVSRADPEGPSCDCDCVWWVLADPHVASSQEE